MRMRKMLRYDRAYPLSRVKSTDSDGLKCWKELVGRLPSATPNPRRGVSNGGRRSREFRILASGLDGSMPLTVSWPPSRNHPLPLFLLFLLFPILFLPRLYSTVNHNAFRTRLYRILRIKCRNSLSALSTRFSLDPYSLSLSIFLTRLVRTFKYEGRRIKGRRTPRGLLRKIGKDTQHRTVCYIYSRNDPWLFFSSRKGKRSHRNEKKVLSIPQSKSNRIYPNLCLNRFEGR